MPWQERRAKGRVLRLPHPADKSPSHQATLSVWGPRGVSVLLNPPCLFPGDQVRIHFLLGGGGVQTPCPLCFPLGGKGPHLLSPQHDAVPCPRDRGTGGQVRNVSDPSPPDISIRAKARAERPSGTPHPAKSQTTTPSAVTLPQSPESQVAGALGDTQTEPSLDQVLRERDEAIAK